MKFWKISLACLGVIGAVSVAQAGIMENHMMSALEELAQSRQPLEMAHIRRVFKKENPIAHTDVPEVFNPKFGWMGFFNSGSFEGQKIFVHLQYRELPATGGMLCTAYEKNKAGDKALTLWEHVGADGQFTGLMHVGTLPLGGLEGSGLYFDEKKVRALGLTSEMRRRFRALGEVSSDASASASASASTSALVSIVDAPTSSVMTTTTTVTAQPTAQTGETVATSSSSRRRAGSPLRPSTSGSGDVCPVVATPPAQTRPQTAALPTSEARASGRPRTDAGHRTSTRSSEVPGAAEQSSTPAPSKHRSEKHRSSDAAAAAAPASVGEKPSRASHSAAGPEKPARASRLSKDTKRK